MYPGYVFCRVRLDKQLWSVMVNTQKVIEADRARIVSVSISKSTRSSFRDSFCDLVHHIHHVHHAHHT